MPTLIPAITNAAGERLGSRLDLPLEGSPLAYAIFAHCFTCTKNIKAAAHISRSLTRQRIAVLRFDFTGLGESEGDFSETNFTSNVADLQAVASYLAREFEAPRLLIGHSLGGSAALQAACVIPSIQAVVTIAAPFEASHLTGLLADAKRQADASGETRDHRRCDVSPQEAVLRRSGTHQHAARHPQPGTGAAGPALPATTPWT
ncbi:MAG: alpha/beta fold hydrolase [Caldilineales bacterium]